MMWQTLIKQEQAYLGPFPCMLNPGDMQSMNFLPGDDGPFLMTAEECERKCYDKDTGIMWK